MTDDGNIEEVEDGVMPPLRAVPETTLDEVAGCLKWNGPRLSIEEMDAAIERETMRRAGR